MGKARRDVLLGHGGLAALTAVSMILGGTAFAVAQNAEPPGGGANQPGPYDPSGVGAPSGNGSDNNNGNRPCAGCVGSADDKNPPGQLPGGQDPNAGYECDTNQGVGQTNPAHSGCSSTTVAPPPPPGVNPPPPPGGNPPPPPGVTTTPPPPNGTRPGTTPGTTPGTATAATPVTGSSAPGSPGAGNAGSGAVAQTPSRAGARPVGDDVATAPAASRPAVAGAARPVSGAADLAG